MEEAGRWHAGKALCVVGAISTTRMLRREPHARTHAARESGLVMKARMRRLHRLRMSTRVPPPRQCELHICTHKRTHTWRLACALNFRPKRPTRGASEGADYHRQTSAEARRLSSVSPRCLKLSVALLLLAKGHAGAVVVAVRGHPVQIHEPRAYGEDRQGEEASCTGFIVDGLEEAYG